MSSIAYVVYELSSALHMTKRLIVSKNGLISANFKRYLRILLPIAGNIFIADDSDPSLVWPEQGFFPGLAGMLMGNSQFLFRNHQRYIVSRPSSVNESAGAKALQDIVRR